MRRMMRSAIGGVLAAILGLTAYVAVILAIGIVLAQAFGVITALVILAAATLILAGVILAIVGGMNHQTEKRAEARQREAAKRLPSPMAMQMLAGLPALMRGRSVLTTVLIAGVAYAVAKNQGVGSDDE